VVNQAWRRASLVALNVRRLNVAPGQWLGISGLLPALLFKP